MQRGGIWYYLKDAILKGGIRFDKATPDNRIRVSRRRPTIQQDLQSSNVLSIHHHDEEKIPEMYDGSKGLKMVVDVGGST
ncbi:hypothetical protein NL676_017839 [Syzygium grande]|nr:hypothetical protein NL676_017839 [Syzygium grande]